MIRNPFMLRKTHDKSVEELLKKQELAYYNGAKETGRRVREWAVDANLNIYNANDSRVRPLVTAAFQDAIKRFNV